MGDIAYQNKDVTAKVMAEALKGKSLAPFGIHQLKIVDILPTILPVIESNELRLDNLFLLSDGSIGIMDYESAYNQENFVKYINYMARVIKRYAINHELDRIKQIKMIVIYTADVDHAEAIYDLGGIVLKIEPTFLVEADTKAQYDRIRQRIDAGERLTDEELMELMILPLTVKGKKEKQPVIISAVELAKRIADRKQALEALAGILTFSDKLIDEAYKRQIKEEMRMTQIGQMLIDEGMEKGMKKGIEKGMEKGIQALIEDNREDGVSEERIIEKLQKRFSMDRGKAESYLERFTQK